MCPQLVDFNADGHKDIVVGTFEGVAFLVPGSKDGFGEPERILDVDKQTILLSMFWNRTDNKWDNADRSPAGEKHPQDHCISVVAVDWDNDGDLDLLLGAKEGGLYLRRNNGKPGKSAFAATNERLRAGDDLFMVPGGLTAPRLVDWNGDGNFDLLCGSFGGGVYLYLNQGKPGQPQFGKPQVLVTATENADDRGGEQPTRPTQGCYADAFDYDGDGDLDLLVGGYSQWTPAKKQLTEAEEAQRQKLSEEMAALRKAQSELLQAVRDKAKDDPEKLQKLYQEVVASKEFQTSATKLRNLYAKLNELTPSPRREAFVWLYRRK